MQQTRLYKTIAAFTICLVIPAYSFASISMQELIEQSKKIHVQCTAAKDLKLNPKTKIWSADGGWKTYSPSFGTQIATFQGAQWNGVQLGQIICVYRAKDSFVFPIKLFYSHQVIMPDGSQWQRARSNVRNCVDNQKNCQFSPLLTPKQANPIKEAEGLINKPSNTLPEQNL